MKRITDYFRKNFKVKLVSIVAAAVAIVLLTTLVNSKRKTITLVIDGQKKTIVTYKNTVGQVLKSNDIYVGPKDKLNPSINSKLDKSDTISLKRAVNLHIYLEGKNLSVLSSEPDIASMIKAEGIEFDSDDKIVPEIDTPLYEDLRVDIVKVDTRTFTDTVPMSFKEVVKYDSSMLNTKQKVVHEGKDGEKQITISVTYENGHEVSRRIVNEVVVKKPVDKVIAQGTYPHMPVSRGGRIMPYSKVFKARATAYWAVRGVGTTYTASGRKAVRNSSGYSTISVDPKVIPLGTKIFIEGYGFAVAADTGTAIKGNKIDVYFNTYNEACRWGAKHVNVYVLQ